MTSCDIFTLAYMAWITKLEHCIERVREAHGVWSCLPVSPSEGTWPKPQETLENWACAQVILHGRMRVLSIQRAMGLVAKHSLHDCGHIAGINLGFRDCGRVQGWNSGSCEYYASLGVWAIPTQPSLCRAYLIHTRGRGPRGLAAPSGRVLAREHCSLSVQQTAHDAVPCPKEMDGP